MNMRYLIVSALFRGVCPLFAREKADLLIMNNGDRVMCEIKGLSNGTLYVSLDWVQGTVQGDWLKVNHMESKQLFLVKTQDGRVYMGGLSTPQTNEERPMRLEIIEEAGTSKAVEQAQVVGIDQTSENFWHRFNGAINSGFTYAKANQTPQYTLGADTQYTRESWTSGANFTSTLTSNTGATTSTRNNVQGYYPHLMSWDIWFYTGMGSLLQSTEQQIRLQSNRNGDLDRSHIESPKASVDSTPERYEK
jgi:hypothetical protein